MSTAAEKKYTVAENTVAERAPPPHNADERAPLSKRAPPPRISLEQELSLRSGEFLLLLFNNTNALSQRIHLRVCTRRPPPVCA
jgi:hypothetical protein